MKTKMMSLIVILALATTAMAKDKKPRLITPIKYATATVTIYYEAYQKEADGGYGDDLSKDPICKFTMKVPVWNMGAVDLDNENNDYPLNTDPLLTLPEARGCKTSLLGKEVLVYINSGITKFTSHSKKAPEMNGPISSYHAELEVEPTSFKHEILTGEDGVKYVSSSAHKQSEEDIDFQNQVRQEGGISMATDGLNKKTLLTIESDLYEICNNKSTLSKFKSAHECYESGIKRFHVNVVIKE